MILIIVAPELKLENQIKDQKNIKNIKTKKVEQVKVEQVKVEVEVNLVEYLEDLVL